jgi:hypothetical protein
MVKNRKNLITNKYAFASKFDLIEWFVYFVALSWISLVYFRPKIEIIVLVSLLIVLFNVKKEKDYFKDFLYIPIYSIILITISTISLNKDKIFIQGDYKMHIIAIKTFIKDSNVALYNQYFFENDIGYWYHLEKFFYPNTSHFIVSFFAKYLHLDPQLIFLFFLSITAFFLWPKNLYQTIKMINKKEKYSSVNVTLMILTLNLFVFFNFFFGGLPFLIGFVMAVFLFRVNILGKEINAINLIKNLTVSLPLFLIHPSSLFMYIILLFLHTYNFPKLVNLTIRRYKFLIVTKVLISSLIFLSILILCKNIITNFINSQSAPIYGTNRISADTIDRIVSNLYQYFASGHSITIFPILLIIILSLMFKKIIHLNNNDNFKYLFVSSFLILSSLTVGLNIEILHYLGRFLTAGFNSHPARIYGFFIFTFALFISKLDLEKIKFLRTSSLNSFLWLCLAISLNIISIIEIL